MIKMTEWDRLYRHNIDWAISRMEPVCLEKYKDKQQDWVEALIAFSKIQEEIFKNYNVNYKSGNKYHKGCIKGIEFTADQLFEVFHRHMNQHTNYTVRYFIFNWWNRLRPYVDGAQPTLGCPWLFFKPATKEEIKKARKDFKKVAHVDPYTKKVSYFTHTFNDDATVLEYRGNRFIIDNEWGEAWTINKKGEPKSFQLDWDWWYPIDKYLDLYKKDFE